MSLTLKFNFSILLFFIFCTNCVSQIYVESEPYSWSQEAMTRQLKKVPYVDFPALDMDYVRDLEEKETAAGLA